MRSWAIWRFREFLGSGDVVWGGVVLACELCELRRRCDGGVACVNRCYGEGGIGDTLLWRVTGSYVLFTFFSPRKW